MSKRAEVCMRVVDEKAYRVLLDAQQHPVERSACSSIDNSSTRTRQAAQPRVETVYAHARLMLAQDRRVFEVPLKSHRKNDCNHEALKCWRGPRPCYPYQSKRPRRASTIENWSSRHSRFLLQSHSGHHGLYSNHSDSSEPRPS
jgi:hypothetical protein